MIDRRLALALLGASLAAACSPPAMPLRPLAAAAPGPAGVVHRAGRFAASDGAVLFEQSWRPASGRARAVLVIHHGLKSHGAHYAELAARLVSRGVAVYAHDMRGHGRSPGRRATLDDLGVLAADLDRFIAGVRRAEPGAPLFLAGHSVGGAVVTLYTVERRPRLEGLVLLAPALRVDQPPIAAAAAGIAGALTPGFPAVDVPNEWFSRSPAVRREMARDPLIYQPAGPARTARALTRALARIWPRVEEIDVPLLGLHGTGDRATSPRGTAELVRRARSRDRTLLLYRGLYHDLVREPERDQVIGDIERWIARRIPAAGG